jgi:hypothetical protein
MRVELTRFRIVPGKSERVDEWLGLLNERMPETLATLERERMHVEVIFRERVGEEEFLSWFAIQGEDGEHVRTSPHEIDKLHLEYWRECIDENYGAHDAVPQVVMVPTALATAIGWAEPKDAAVTWVGQSTWKRPRGAAGADRERDDSEGRE